MYKHLRISSFVLLLLAFPLSSAVANSEFVDAHGSFLSLYSPNQANLDLKYRFAPERKDDGEGSNEFDEHVFSAGIVKAIPFSEDTALPLRAVYEARLLDLDQRSEVLDDDQETLHRIEFSPGISTFINENLLFMGAVRVGVFGNLKGSINGDDWQVLGSGEFAYSCGNDLMFTAGVSVSEDFDDAAVLPLLGLRYRAGSWFFDVRLPQKAEISYSFTDAVSLYGGGYLSGSQYRVDLGNGEDFDIQLRDQKVGGGLMWWLSDSFRLTVEGGVLVGQDAFEVKVGGREFEGDLDEGGYFEVGAGLRF